MNETMRKGGVAEGGRNLPPPFHGPQQLETIYYHHGYPIVSHFDKRYYICIHYDIYYLSRKKNGLSLLDNRPSPIVLYFYVGLRDFFLAWTKGAGNWNGFAEKNSKRFWEN